jgi:MoaA/NifB/PqqE/SkfB family radical SAM enzyme
MCEKRSPLPEMLFRFDAYLKLALQAMQRGLSLSDLIRARYPYFLADAEKPPVLLLELTNYCNLSCTYCPIEKDKRAKGFMSEETFGRVLSQLEDMRINRVHVRGWGEPTLHPDFCRFMPMLAKQVRLVDIVTNGQWKDPAIGRALVTAPVHRIDISIDVGGSDIYESARHRSSYARLERNIKDLRRFRETFGSKSKIIVRSMFRPSQTHLLREEMRLWGKYADAVMPSPLVKPAKTATGSGCQSDAYVLTASEDEYPRCYFPFNEANVSWDGAIPLCDNLVLGREKEEFSLGNIGTHSLREIWRGPEMRRLRNGHRHQINSDRKMCKGCTTCSV